MEGEAWILQKRIEARALKRGGVEAQERVGREQQEGEKADADQPLDTQHAGAQTGRQVAPEPGDHKAEQCEDQNPQQHRSFMISPDARHLVEHRFERVGRLRDKCYRKIGHHIRVCQRAERD